MVYRGRFYEKICSNILNTKAASLFTLDIHKSVRWYYTGNSSIRPSKGLLWTGFGTKLRFQIIFQGRHAHIRDKRQPVVIPCQILKMETQDYRAVVKHCVKSWWVPKKYMKSWVAYGVRTALNTKQLKLVFGTSDVPGPRLVENRGHVAKKCYHPQKHRHSLRHGDQCPTSDSCADSGHIRP